MADEFKLKGADQFIAALRQFPIKLQKKGVRRAARAGMAIVRDAARANARAIDDPSTPLNIAKLIAIQESAKQGKREGGIVMRVGVRGGAVSSDKKVTPWYWRLIELGTVDQQARPFMVPALTQNIGAVTDKTVTTLSEEIDKLAAESKVRT